MTKGKPPAKGFQKGNQLAKLGDHSKRPIKKFITQQIIAALNDPSDPDDMDSKANYVVMIDALVERAKKGEMECVHFLVERAEGKVTQEVRGRIEHQTNLDNLTDEELDKFIELHRKVIDVTPEEVED